MRRNWKDWKKGEVRLQMKIVTANGGCVDVYVPHLHKDWESLLSAVQMLAIMSLKRRHMPPTLKSLTRMVVEYLGKYSRLYRRRKHDAR
jgi:hypothetical protein